MTGGEVEEGIGIRGDAAGVVMDVEIGVEEGVGAALFFPAGAEEVDRGIGSGVGDVGVHSGVVAGVEEGAGQAVFTGTEDEVVGEGIESGGLDIGVLREVVVGVEGGLEVGDQVAGDRGVDAAEEVEKGREQKENLNMKTRAVTEVTARVERRETKVKIRSDAGATPMNQSAKAGESCAEQSQCSRFGSEGTVDVESSGSLTDAQGTGEDIVDGATWRIYPS